MADHQRLLQDMQSRFPNLPKDLVRSYVLKYSFDREKCFQYLIQAQRTHNPGTANFWCPPGSTYTGSTGTMNHNPFSQDVNLKMAMESSGPGNTRRTSYPVYHNGNHENVRNNQSQHSAPPVDLPFQFGNVHSAYPQKPLINLPHPDTHYQVPRINRSPGVPQGSPAVSPRYSPVGSVQPRFPSPTRHPSREVTFKQPELALPHDHMEYPYSENRQHISTLEISPGPFQSSQFTYYKGLSSSQQQQGASHTTSFNVQVPSKSSLTTQIFVQTSGAGSPQHYPPLSSSPRYQEPVLTVSSALPSIPDSMKDKLKTGGLFQPGQTNYSASKPEQDEKAYIQALLVHQRAGHDLLYLELTKLKEQLKQMKGDLLVREEELYKGMGNTSNPVITAEATSKLCEEIRKLRVDCHCMSMEVDLLNSNQIPLGETNENFYGHIFSGQAGKLVSGSALTSAMATALAVASPSQSQPPDGMLQNGCHDEVRPQEKDWTCSACTFENHACLSVCEMCEIPRNPLPISGNSPASTYKQPCYCHARH